MNESNLLYAAIELQRLGQNAEAKNTYLEILNKLPNSELALNNIGALEATLGNYEDACKYFEKLVNLFPTKINALINYASALELCDNFNDAIEAYSRVLEIDPDNFKSLLRLGALFKRLGRITEAQQIYKKVLALDPENLEALNNLGNLLRDIGMIDDALSYLTKAANTHGGNETIYNNIATIYSDIECYEKALKFYDLALAKNPSHILALNGKGNVLRELGKLEKAITYFQTAAAVDPCSLISQSNLAGACIASKKNDDEKIFEAKRAINTYLNNIKKEKSLSMSFFALKHHLGQAKYLELNGIEVPGSKSFINSAEVLINNFNSDESLIFLDESCYQKMREYFGAYLVYETPKDVIYGLNPNNDWKKIEEEYFDSKETVAIDNFLSAEALDALYKFCLISKVWIREYPKCYLGAFGYQGFISRLHLKIARELSECLPRVFQDYLLSHLWAFKYDSKLGAGINVHADPAKVNVNFWLTPDEFNLEKDRGGLIVYSRRANEDWNFDAYNNDQKKIYEYLSEGDQSQINIPYKRNRCVLFNSILFHETDKIDFCDVYEGRRINMTYLFGQK
ncbi:tetratricopeptide repeat protein [Polynucleobacter sp. MWH-P3-07-1]|uniref:tetratricopeptide repeat protein n=1 Tax=Polynucleobacter sp. MWH-P3-07-1 TaxID=1743173 RepID=UPI001BFE280D|nr:tetratricopeptide repeat protein [Polynucleobacter sp. MWH-P3-07-1]QWD83488.1 tetratricopeptide repeat protein [Polynucleobacter sp. MWH-P3-07-1]